MTRTVVLLSGGLDSVAALHWAMETRSSVSSIGFRYGQPHADAELAAAGTIAARRGVPFEVAQIIDLPRLDPVSGHDDRGVSRAFVPVRNAIFLTLAAAHAAKTRNDFVLVMGATANDYGHFPDCRPAFFEAAREMLGASFKNVCAISVTTPWLYMDKALVLRWCSARPAAMEDVRASVSCYRGTRCGNCDACWSRARAFEEAGIEDSATIYSIHGGDPHREKRR